MYDCLSFSWPEIAGLTMSHSAMTRGVDWCVNTVLSVGELDCLSMFVCTHDAGAIWLKFSGHNRCIGHRDGKEKRWHSFLSEVKQFLSLSTHQY